MSEATNVVVGVKRENENDPNETGSAKKIKIDTRNNDILLKKDEVKTEVEGPPIKRKMVALLMAYSGQGYLGMQRNPGVKTIEEDLLTSLLKVGAIYQDQFETPQYSRFQRSCRTDKGVSAIRQIVSLRLALMDNLVEKLNENLPPQIRVLGCKRVTGNFNCKTACDARTYTYTLPTFAFAPIEEETNENFRAPESVVQTVNEILAKYKGTHNFHNFTAGKSGNDASAQRYIIEFECGQPFVRDGIELAVIRVKGQSFMLHQIRKMVGLTIAIVRGFATVDTIIKAWCPQRIDIPIAPGLGLVLEQVHYDKYNKRFGGDGMHEALLWDECNDEILKFKEKFIFPTIVETEKNEKSMLKWLETLCYHTYDLRDPSAPSHLNTIGKLAYSLKHKAKEEVDAKENENTAIDAQQATIISKTSQNAAEENSNVINISANK